MGAHSVHCGPSGPEREHTCHDSLMLPRVSVELCDYWMRERGSDGKGESEWKLERTDEVRQEVQDWGSDTVYQRVKVSLGVSEMEF